MLELIENKTFYAPLNEGWSGGSGINHQCAWRC